MIFYVWIPIALANTLLLFYKQRHYHSTCPQLPNAEGFCCFLAWRRDSLVKYDVCKNNFYNLKNKYFIEGSYVKNVVKVREMVYVTTHYGLDYINVSATNLSNPSENRKVFLWSTSQEFFHKPHIAFRDSILAAGSQFVVDMRDCYDYYCGKNTPTSVKAEKLIKINPEVYMHNTTSTPNNNTLDTSFVGNMNEERIGNALVLFNGTVCAVGGSSQPSVECLDGSTNKWYYAPHENTSA